MRSPWYSPSMPPARISMNKMRGPKIRSVEQSEEAEAGRGGKCRFKTPRGSSRGLTCRLRSPPSFSRSCSCCSKDCTFFSSGLIFPAVPSATGRIRPALHARRSRGGFDGQLLRRIRNSNDVSRDETACDGSHHTYEVAWARRERGRTILKCTPLVC